MTSYDSEGTATHAESLGTLFDHIHNAELANKFLNQGPSEGTKDAI